jgi:hypothetical protein
MGQEGRFNGLSKQSSGGKPLKGLKGMCQAMSTGLKLVNESEDTVNPVTNLARTTDSGSSLKELLRSRRYLENRYARIFGELPLAFSNDAPAVI